MANSKFGTGQDTCRVCGVKLTDIKAVKLNLKHKTGAELFDLLYYAPLCDQHRGDGSLDVNIGWETGTFPLDKMKESP